jgi:hypothetical protein
VLLNKLESILKYLPILSPTRKLIKDYKKNYDKNKTEFNKYKVYQLVDRSFNLSFKCITNQFLIPN